MFRNQVVFCVIITQYEPEVSALGQCDSGTCRFAFVITTVPGSIPVPGCLEL